MGFLMNEELFITGRSANKIIIRGRNFYAEDIETLIVSSQESGLFAGVAAFSFEDNGAEKICILVELEKRDRTLNLESLLEQVSGGLGARPEIVAAVPRYSLPRTSSGKVRRHLVSAAFAEKQLKYEVLFQHD